MIGIVFFSTRSSIGTKQNKMGSGSSRYSPEIRRQSQLIDLMLAEEKKRQSSIFKMLLLGPGDSGKSTIVKQMRLLHSNGFSKEEIALQQSVIAGNILNSITVIANVMQEFGIDFQKPARKSDAERIISLEKRWTFNDKLDVGDWACLKRLWEDSGVQACFARSNEYQLNDSTQFFCDQIDRYMSPNFVPDDQDMLRSRVSTTGIVEIAFQLGDTMCNVFDVGGQRSQRKKWIHCFEGVNALIYVTSLSEYNQVLLEDSNVNRMRESLSLFGTIFNCAWFRKTDFLLFLNKKDLFEEKLRRFPLSETFPDYRGESDYNDGATFVERLFDKGKANGIHLTTTAAAHAKFRAEKKTQKAIYTHRTCATDTRNMEFVLNAGFDIILRSNVKSTGFL